MLVKNTKAKIIAIISLAISSSACAVTDNNIDEISCYEFINLNLDDMTPISAQILNESYKYKGGDTVTLTEVSEEYLPEIIKSCKRSPSLKVKDVINQMKIE